MKTTTKWIAIAMCACCYLSLGSVHAALTVNGLAANGLAANGLAPHNSVGQAMTHTNEPPPEVPFEYLPFKSVSKQALGKTRP